MDGPIWPQEDADAAEAAHAAQTLSAMLLRPAPLLALTDVALSLRAVPRFADSAHQASPSSQTLRGSRVGCAGDGRVEDDESETRRLGQAALFECTVSATATARRRAFAPLVPLLQSALRGSAEDTAEAVAVDESACADAGAGDGPIALAASTLRHTTAPQSATSYASLLLKLVLPDLSPAGQLASQLRLVLHCEAHVAQRAARRIVGGAWTPAHLAADATLQATAARDCSTRLQHATAARDCSTYGSTRGTLTSPCARPVIASTLQSFRHTLILAAA
eukprot:2104300-Pleurochrysis_carterae.AAC.7